MLMKRLVYPVRHSSRRRDAAAILTILSTWLLFYWRLFAPAAAPLSG